MDTPEEIGAMQQVLSIRGGLTGQFEPRYISSPEALVAAWSYQAGDKKLAARIIFPRIDESPDDLDFATQISELIGKVYYQRLLDAFTDRRDYDEAIRIANHLSEPEFDHYFYQPRAKELAAQLQKRGEDFKSLTLPAAGDWAKRKAAMSRGEQVKFLADRLRLLNCAQWGQPGDVNYTDPQWSAPGSAGDRKEVINPFNELRAMKLSPTELAFLAPYLTDDDFMLVFSFWRDFHPERHLHRVNWAVQDIINEAAGNQHRRVAGFIHAGAEKKRLPTKCSPGAVRTARSRTSSSSSTRWRPRRIGGISPTPPRSPSTRKSPPPPS